MGKIGKQLFCELRPVAAGYHRHLYHTQQTAEQCGHLGIEQSQLPLLWDADFFYGPKDTAGLDTWVLCEINVSSVYPFPDDALMPLAAATLAVLQGRQ